MSEPIIFIDTSEIREGKLEELKKAISGLVGFVESCEPRPLSSGNTVRLRLPM